jgi:hypothetical protein
MRRLPAALALVLLLASPAAADEPATLGPCGPIERLYDAVEVPVLHLRKLGGTSIARLTVIAFRDGRPVPIPFQVDERRGRKIAMPDGPDPSDDDRPGELDPDDVVVFMACDAGEARGTASIEQAFADAGVSAWREVRIADPRAQRSAFVYVVVAERPPASDRRYVVYEPAADLVRSASYRVGLVDALPTYFALSTRGGVGPNLLDGLRLRAEATLRANLARWTLNERQGRHELVAWKAGPVRVARRSRHEVAVGLGIHLTAGLAHTYVYPRHVYGPGSLKLPFSPGIMFKEITAFGGVDARDLDGWHYYAPGTPAKGFTVDGGMDDAERAFASTGDWFALARRDRALLVVTRMSENLARVVPLRLVYRDDTEHPNPPENAPGTMPLAGYEGREVAKLPGGRYEFALRILVLDRFRHGDEHALLAPIDQPLDVTVGEVPASVRASDAGAPPAAR